MTTCPIAGRLGKRRRARRPHDPWKDAPASDQLARELNAKRVVITPAPAPAWLLRPLGGPAVAGWPPRRLGLAQNRAPRRSLLPARLQIGRD